MGAFGYQQTSNGGGPLEMFRGELDASGDPIFEEVDRGAYVAPPRGEYVLMVTGFSRPWEEPNKFRPGEMSKKTNLELEIVEGLGAGHKFLWSFQTFTLAMGEMPSNCGRIYSAGVLDGARIERGKQVFFDDMIRKPFIAYVNPSDALNDKGQPKYASVAKETIAPYRPASEDTSYNPFKKPNAA